MNEQVKTKLIKLSSLKADLDTEKNGKWVEYPTWPGVAFLVASPLNPEFETAQQLAIQSVNRLGLSPEAHKQKLEDAVRQVYHDHILKDWRGFDEPLTPDLKREVFFALEYRNVADAIMLCANRVAEVNVAYIEDEAKNSERPSAGN